MSRQVVWTPEKLEALSKEFKDGATVANMAVSRGVSRIRIYQLLKKAGLALRPRNNEVGPVTQDSIDRLNTREMTDAN